MGFTIFTFELYSLPSKKGGLYVRSRLQSQVRHLLFGGLCTRLTSLSERDESDSASEPSPSLPDSAYCTRFTFRAEDRCGRFRPILGMIMWVLWKFENSGRRFSTDVRGKQCGREGGCWFVVFGKCVEVWYMGWFRADA